MLARAFCSEPNCSTLPEIRPEMETKFIDWLEFFNYWMDHCSTNGLSVIALDKENCRVAGVFIVRDLLMIPSGKVHKGILRRPQNFAKSLPYFSGPSSLGVPGVPWHTQILADQLTLFQPGGQIMPT